jgi:D-alanyl-D-alanine dipeptidase
MRPVNQIRPLKIKPGTRYMAPGLALLCMMALTPCWAGEGLPQGFVYLRDIDPSISQDIRYAGPDNFMGRAVPGYEASECVLAAPAARALSRVQQSLKPQGLTLKVYDCYRPARAVRAFVDWADAPGPDPRGHIFHPDLKKPELLAQEYIAAPSGHSLGTAVDLTIVPASSSASPAGADSSIAAGPCTAPLAERGPDNSVDMGTSFDCFDALSHTANPEIGDKQRHWRTTLLEAMQAQGFQNYPKEWWHFSIALEGYDKHQDFPIKPMPSSE